MNLRGFLHWLILPLCLIGLLAVPVRAENPLKSITSGLKKVGNALNPFKKAAPTPKALPPTKPPQPSAKPGPASTRTGSYSKKKQSTRSSSKSETTKSRTKPREDDSPEGPLGETASPESDSAAPGKPGEDKANYPDPSSGVSPPQSFSSGTGLPPPAADTKTAGPAGTPASPPAAPDDSASGPAAKPGVPKEIPFGTPILGRPGYARSPYARDAGEVDVVGIAAGSKVKCPFSGKIFRVP